MYALPKSIDNKSVAILPVSRIVFASPFRVGHFYFFPPGSLDIISLNPAAPANLEDFRVDGNVIVLDKVGIRWGASSLTGFDIDTLENNPLIVFEFDCDWSKFKEMSHDDDVDLIKRLSAEAERALDVIRFIFCQLDLPDTLPGTPGSWDGSGQFLGAMVRNPTNDRSYLLSGAGVECNLIVKGLGLDVDTPLNSFWLDREGSGLSGIIIHALSLLSDAMYASTETSRFARVMTLLEFLGSPDEYKTWKKLRGEIICHIARDKNDYLRLVERFKELTSKEDDNDVQTGYRTLIVHHGKFLHELLSDQKGRRRLFRELHGYATKVLQDMISHKEMSWDSFLDYRKQLKRQLGAL
jgi:hypothetical protein